MDTIVGAGLAGLIAAHAWPHARVFEASPEPREAHKALLRFRSEAVSRLTGVEFRRVQVRKGLWAEGRFQNTNIRWANSYAQKVTGHLRGDRSIWLLDSVDRFIAPEDLYAQLLDHVGSRVSWDTQFDFGANRSPIVSTAPLPVALGGLEGLPPIEFPRSPIRVERFRVPNADVFQTVYFPEPELDVYRASITGDLLIVECVGTFEEPDETAVLEAFGLPLNIIEPLGSSHQKYGKITAIDAALRKQLLFRLTHERQVYSLGRFATWRNILLDDVVDDIGVIKRLLKSCNAYDLRREAS